MKINFDFVRLLFREGDVEFKLQNFRANGLHISVSIRIQDRQTRTFISAVTLGISAKDLSRSILNANPTLKSVDGFLLSIFGYAHVICLQ